MRCRVAQPQIFNAGSKSEFSGIYDFGLGDVIIRDVKIGDTLSKELGGEVVIHHRQPKLKNPVDPTQGYAPVPLKILRLPTASTSLTYGLNDKDDSGVATTRPNSTGARIEISFPQGMVEFKDNGDEKDRGVQYMIYTKKHSAPDTAWKPVNYLTAFDGDHLRVQGNTSIDGSVPGDDSAGGLGGYIELDPRNELASRRDANGNLVLKPGDRLTVRVNAQRDVYQFNPSKVTVDTSFNFFTFQTTPLNPDGHLVVTGGAANGVIVVDPAGDANRSTIFDLEYLVTSPIDSAGMEFKVLTNTLYDAPPPDGKPFSTNLWQSETFNIDVTGAPPVVPDNPDALPPDATQVYNRTAGKETYIYMVKRKMGSSWWPEPGSMIFYVNGVQKVAEPLEIFEAQGAAMAHNDITLSFGGATEREYWYAVKKDYL